MSGIIKKPVYDIIYHISFCAFICLLPGRFNKCCANPSWGRLPRPETRAEGFNDISFDESGVLWASVAYSVFWWDGEQFQEPIGANLHVGVYLSGLYGGPDGGLYITQMGTEPNRGEVYYLDNGQASHVTNFCYDSTTQYPGFYAAKDGRLINWAEGILCVYTNGQWLDCIDVGLEQKSYPIYETDGTIYIYNQGTLISINPNNQISSRQIRTPVDIYTTEVTAQWGDDKALFLIDGREGLDAYDLSTKEHVDISAVNSVIRGYRLYRMLHTQDGSVWILARSEEHSGYCIFRITPGGDIEFIPQSLNLPWSRDYFDLYPKSILQASDGSAWFCVPRLGLLHYHNKELYHFDYRENPCNPGVCTKLVESPNHNIIAVSGSWLYEFSNEESVDTCPWDNLPQISRPEIPVWQYEAQNDDPIRQVWQVENFIVFDLGLSRNTATIVTLNINSGTVQSELNVGSNAWITPGTNSGTALLLSDQNLAVVDLNTGHLINDLEYERDDRIEPVLVDRDFIIVKGYRGSEVCRVTTEGQELWSCRLPGYVMIHPSIQDKFLAVQTRGGSYGGQATSIINVDTGIIMWTDIIDAYGCGVDFTQDARLMVESACWLSPDMTEGRLIARKPRTGVVIWDYRCRMTTISHRPIIDPETGYVYAVFNDGKVVSLKSNSGFSVWETLLPFAVKRPTSASYDPYWSCISADSDYILLIDSYDTIYMLDKMTGRIIAYFDVISATTQYDIRVPTTELVGMPCIIDNMLIVATKQSIKAFDLKSILGM